MENSKIVFLTHGNPFPLSDGYALRAYNICRSLHQAGHYLELLIVNPKHQHSVTEEKYNNICSEYSYLCQSELGILDKIVKMSPLVLSALGDEVYENQRKNIQKKASDADLLFVHSTLSLYCLTYCLDTNTKTIYDLTDSASLMFERELNNPNRLTRKIKYYCLSRWRRSTERAIVEFFDSAVVVSEIDQEHLETVTGGTNISTIRNGVNTDYFSPNKNLSNPFVHSDDTTQLLFHGSMDFGPNIESAKYTMNEVLPKLKRSNMSYNFTIIGKNPIDKIKKYNDRSDVTVTGYVDDIRPYLSHGDIAIMPMKKGSGMKNKILEAAAMDLPIVTNSLGAESFNEALKQELYISENPHKMANYVMDIENKNNLKNTESHLREIVKNDYSWEAVAKMIEQQMYE